MYLENHYSIGISWILAAPPEENLQRLQHASRPWIARIPSQIEESHIQLGYLCTLLPIGLKIQKQHHSEK